MIKMTDIINPQHIIKGDLIQFPYSKSGIISSEEMYEVLEILGNKVVVMGDDGRKVRFPINRVKKEI